MGSSFLRTLGIGAAAAIGGGLAVAGWAVGIERRRFQLRHYDLAVLPAGAAPLRILHFADAHFAPGQRKKQRFVKSLAAYEPDLIIATGDNLGHRDAVPGIAEMLEPFRGVPALSVFGSNDYFGPVAKNPLAYLRRTRKHVDRAPDLDTDALRRVLFDDFGWIDLTNRAADLTVGELRIRAIGVDDPHIELDRLGAARIRLARLEGAADLTLGLVHAPYQRILDPYATEVGVDVIFAGHTHGGQVCLPGGRALVANCDLPREQVGGVSEWRGTPLHVSRGLGTSIYAPVRTFCPPEASIITLTAADAL